jgi:hypothetical protein
LNAKPTDQVIAGTTVMRPSRQGNNTRRQRCQSSALSPFFRQSIAVKKPLTSMKSCIRKPCTHAWKMNGHFACTTSWTIQGKPIAKDSAT